MPLLMFQSGKTSLALKSTKCSVVKRSVNFVIRSVLAISVTAEKVNFPPFYYL